MQGKTQTSDALLKAITKAIRMKMLSLKEADKFDWEEVDKLAIERLEEILSHYQLKTKGAEGKFELKQQTRLRMTRINQKFLHRTLKKKIKIGLLVRPRPQTTKNMKNQS